jgi:serine/threonine-protein kinase RsbW
VVLFKGTKKADLLQQFRLEVKTELTALPEILNWFERVTKYFLPDKVRWQCKLALAEAFTNTVCYAHQNLPAATPIALEVKLFADFLEIRLYDRGQPFDMQTKLRSLQKLLQEDGGSALEREDNRGLLFMQELTDNLQYLHLSEGYNCLVMHKVLEDETSCKNRFLG